MIKTNWRGVATTDLVLEILRLKYDIDMLDIAPEEAIGFGRPSSYGDEQWILEHRQLFNRQLQDVLNELERRRTINETYVKNPDREIIQAIKERTQLADIIEQYTEVFYNGKDRWKFRCTLHGTDTEPSGVIYNKEQRWWCFGCNKGGDVFDAVQAFERIDLPSAIRKLANKLGIELRPLTENKKRMGINV